MNPGNTAITTKPIEIEGNEIMEAVESLRRNVSVLLDGINPVLSPLPQPPNGPIATGVPVVTAASPMAEFMRCVTTNIRSITHDVAQATERLEL